MTIRATVIDDSLMTVDEVVAIITSVAVAKKADRTVPYNYMEIVHIDHVQ